MGKLVLSRLNALLGGKEIKKMREVRVVLFDEQRFHGKWIPRGVVELMHWLEDKIKDIPDKYVSSVKIDVGSVSSYEDSSYATIKIYYYRPETEKEALEREAADQKKLDSIKEQELMHLAELQKKYT